MPTPPTNRPASRLPFLEKTSQASVSAPDYGVELEVTNLARTPTNAPAWISVRAANGDSVTFEATQAKNACLPEGNRFTETA